MSQEEKCTIVSIIVNVIVNGMLAIKLFGLWSDGTLLGPNGAMIWAKSALWAMGITIIATIVLTVLFIIIMAIITGDTDFRTDERDRLFTNRGNMFVMVAGGAGFIAAMIMMAMGFAPVFGFIFVFYAYAIGDLIGNLHKFASYRGLI